MSNLLSDAETGGWEKVSHDPARTCLTLSSAKCVFVCSLLEFCLFFEVFRDTTSDVLQTSFLLVTPPMASQCQKQTI